MVMIVRTNWSGTSGGPGLTQLAFIPAGGDTFSPANATAVVNAVRTFWASLPTFLPNELTLSVDPVIDEYDAASGELTGSVSATTTPAPVLGTSGGTYSGGAGLKITWNTDQIRDGRRVRGTTYVVPAAGIVYSDAGTILPTVRTTVNTRATALISDMNTAGGIFAVWSRPREVSATLPARAGQTFIVLTGTCSTKTAILRGRRD